MRWKSSAQFKEDDSDVGATQDQRSIRVEFSECRDREVAPTEFKTHNSMHNTKHIERWKSSWIGYKS